MNRKWSQEQIDFVKQNANTYNDDKLTLELNLRFNQQFTKGAVRKQRQRLNIKKSGHRGHFKVVNGV